MDKTLGLQLIIYSLLLAGFGYLTHRLAPDLARPTLITCLAGGAFCLAWGLRALRGRCGKALPILTLVVVTFVLLSQTILTWTARPQTVSMGRSAAAVISMLFVLSLAMLMRIAYAGEVFGVQTTGATRERGVEPQTSGKPAAQSGAVRRASGAGQKGC